MKKYILIAFLSVSFQGISCLNQYRENLQGNGVEWPTLGRFYRSFHTDYCQAFVDLYDLSNKENYDFEDLSDVSVHLAHLGEYEASLDLLKWLYHRHPEEYQIVSNLGTLYELNGNVDSAHFFIEKGMHLNPDSHHGSEWFHLKILEAKWAIAKDSTWLETHQVLGLGLDYAVDEYSTLWSHIDDTINQITHQLMERVPFTPTPDLILANVYSELGDMVAVNFSVEDAYYCYKIGKYFGPDNVFGNSEKAEEMKKLMKDIETYDQLEDYFPPKSEYYIEGEIDDLNKSGNISVSIDEEAIDEFLISDDEIRGRRVGMIIISIVGVMLILFVLYKRKKTKESKPEN